MGQTHSHDHHTPVVVGVGRATTTRGLAIVAGLNVGFAVVQVVVGLILGAVVVLADALHQVVDAIGLLTAVIAAGLARRGASHVMSFGWGKSDALGAYTSGLLLLGSIGWVVYEAIVRLFDPVEVSGPGVIAIGVAGIAVNGASVWLIGEGQNLAVKAARLHLIVDLAGSVIVVAAGVVLAGTSLTWIDPVASLLINVLVLHGTWRLLRQASGQLLDRAPDDAVPGDVESVLRSHAGVIDVHHVHSWALGPGSRSVTAHIVLGCETSIHDAQREVAALEDLLIERFAIDHITLQVECVEFARHQ